MDVDNQMPTRLRFRYVPKSFHLQDSVWCDTNNAVEFDFAEIRIDVVPAARPKSLFDLQYDDLVLLKSYLTLFTLKYSDYKYVPVYLSELEIAVDKMIVIKQPSNMFTMDDDIYCNAC
jgi:hypothetical protein